MSGKTHHNGQDDKRDSTLFCIVIFGIVVALLIACRILYSVITVSSRVSSSSCANARFEYSDYGSQRLYAWEKDGSLKQDGSCAAANRIFFSYVADHRGYAGVVVGGRGGFSGIHAINNSTTAGLAKVTPDRQGITVLPPYVGNHVAISISHGKIVPVSGKENAKSGAIGEASPYSVYLFDPKGVALPENLLAAIKLAHYTQYREPDFYAGLSDGRLRQSRVEDGILFFSYVLDHRGYTGFLVRTARYLQDGDVKKIAPDYLEIDVHQPDSGPLFNALRLSHGLITPVTGGLPTSREVVSNHEIGEIYLFNPKGVALPGNELTR